MRPELKRLHSPDIENLETYKPEQPENFGFLLQALIGPAGEEGEESFSIEVCTPKWLEKNFSKEDILIGQHHLIIQEYNFIRLVEKIKKFLMHCSGDTWEEVALKVSRLGMWEFEDYTK